MARYAEEPATTRMERDMASGFLQVLVLATVARDGPIHGYGLLRRMEDHTGRTFWKEGTVYPLLARMEREGLVVSSWGSAASGPRRKDYAITAHGRRTLEDATTVWHDLRTHLDRLLERPS